MKSLDTLLGEAVTKMKTETRKNFANKTTGEKLSQEALMNIAESMLREDGEEVRQSGRIRRNNGTSGAVSESEARMAGLKEAQVEAYLASGFDEKMARSMAGIDEADPAGEPMTEAQRADAEFCRLIGLSEADALRVAKSNAIRG